MKTKIQASYASLFLHMVMTYLIKIQQIINKFKIATLLIDLVQFAVIQTFIILQVYCYHNHQTLQSVLNPVLSIVFNYHNIYTQLIYAGAILAIIVILNLIFYLVFLDAGFAAQTYSIVLKYCVLVSAICIFFFQLIFQMMANNLINAFQQILSGKSMIGVSIICFFFLNVFMMILVSIFNSQNRIFGFALIVVSVSLNLAPLLITYLVISILGFIYLQKQQNIFKGLLYSQLIITSIWAFIQLNDQIQDNSNFHQSITYLLIASIAAGLVICLKRLHNSETSLYCQNVYLVNLYLKKIKKQDKQQDYYHAQIYFNTYFEESSNEQNIKASIQPCHDYLFHKTQVIQWPIEVFKAKLLQKIAFNAQKQNNTQSLIRAFQLKLDLDVKNICMLKEVFQFISQKQNQNIYVKYLIVKLIYQIQTTFSEAKGDTTLNLDDIMLLEKAYVKFYKVYDLCLSKLLQFYSKLRLSKGVITNEMQQRFSFFFDYKKILSDQNDFIIQKIGFKVESTLNIMLNQVCSPYQKKLKKDSFQNKNKNDEESLNFCYIIMTDKKKINYGSMKFFQNFLYNEDYITNQNISSILPKKFDRYLSKMMKQNEQLNKFSFLMPILNQKGLFDMFSLNFHLLPELKGQITYAMLIKKISVENQVQKSLILFNCETFTIECFNCQIVQNFCLSVQKIRFLLSNKTIQFQDIFNSTNPQKQGIIFNKKVDKNQDNLLKAMFRTSIISKFKKSIQEEVIICVEDQFNIQNVVFKVLSVTSNNLRRKRQMSINQKQQASFSSLPAEIKSNVASKDLKKKYQDQTFFCAIPNPYKLKILQKIQSLSKPNLTNNINVIVSLLLLMILITLGTSIAFVQLQTNKQFDIDYLKRQAQSLNTQYGQFQQALYYVYSLYHLRHYNQSFVDYLTDQFAYNSTYAQKLVNDSIAYRLNKKDKSLRKFQQNYFDFPNLPGQTGIHYVINFGIFKLDANSQMSTIFDFFTWLVQQNDAQILKLLVTNYNQLKRIAPFYLPTDRYAPKIKDLSMSINIIFLCQILVCILVTIIIFVLLYQLKDIKKDIMSIYKSINIKQIQKIGGQLETISQIRNKLKNNLNDNKQKLNQNQWGQSDLQSFSTFNNISQNGFKDLQNHYSNIELNLAQNINNQKQEDNQLLIDFNQAQPQLKDSSCCELLSRVILQNIIIIFLYVGIVLFAYWSYFETNTNNQSYVKAFQYLQKSNKIHIQYVVQTNTFYQYPLYYQLTAGYYVDDNPVSIILSGTNLGYETSDSFSIQIDQNMCASTIKANVLDPLIAWQNCSTVGYKIFQSNFAQAFPVYQLNLHQLSNQTYANLIMNSTINQKFFSLFYQYEVFSGYFDSIQQNFNLNMKSLYSDIKSRGQQILGYTILFLVVFIFLIYKKSINQLINETKLLVQLFKMIPEETLFNMKTAYQFKKRQLLQKIQKL